MTYTIDTTQGYLAILIVRAHIFYLDKVLPYEKSVIKRILIQFVSTSFIGLFIISSTTELASLIAKGSFAPFSFYSFDLFIISIWFFVVNGVYIMLYFIQQWDRYQHAFKPESVGLQTKVGAKNVVIPFSNLLLLKADQDYTQLIDSDNKKYFQNESLNKLEDKLPGQVFFRLNRQVIINKQLVKSFSRIENGKLKVEFTELVSIEPQIISRDKAPQFKKWLSN